MELKQLRYFKAAAEELHFQRAARRLNLTQPALSYQIKMLEEELDIILLDRSRNHVELTAAGAAFLQRITGILDDIEKAKQQAKEIAGLEQTSLTIGTIDYLNIDRVTKSMMLTKIEHPTINIEHIEMPTNEIYEAVKEGQIDLAIGPLPVTHPALIVKKLTSGHWSLVVPKNHAFAGQAEVPINQLADHPLILFDKALNPSLYNWWMENFKLAGFKPGIVLETKQVQTALKAVKDGMALYIVASYIVDDLSDELTCIPLTGFDNAMSVGAVWHENNKSKALAVYLDVLRKVKV